jgi:hypothetical protein
LTRKLSVSVRFRALASSGRDISFVVDVWRHIMHVVVTGAPLIYLEGSQIGV